MIFLKYKRGKVRKFKIKSITLGIYSRIPNVTLFHMDSAILWVNLWPHSIIIRTFFNTILGFPDGPAVKNLPALGGTWVQFLGREDPLEEGMATHSSILAWRIPWMEELGGLQSMELQRVRHDWATKKSCTRNTICLHPVPQCQLYRALDGKICLTKPDTFGNTSIATKTQHAFPVYGLCHL